MTTPTFQTRNIFSVVAALLLILPTAAAAEQKQNIDEANVRVFIEDSSDAWRKNDAAKIGESLSSDFINILPNGRMQTREHIVHAIKNGLMKFTDYKIEDLKIRTYGQTAVATYVINARFQRRGEEGQDKFATTDVIVLSENKLKFVSSHSSIVAPQKATVPAN